MFCLVKKIMNFIFLFSLLFFSYSCKKKFKPAKPAFFVTCEKVSVNVQPGQGFGSHKFTDLWLYTNGKFRGAYPVGSLMPVMIEDGKSVIDVFPGFMNNGISTTRNFNLFYEPIKLDTLVEPGKHIVRNFTFKYKSSVVFAWVENFELPGTSLVKSAVSDTDFVFHNNDQHVFEGAKSIEFGLSGSSQIAQFESAVSYSLPLTSGNVYLELDYKCNTDFAIGVISNSQYFEAIQVSPKESWNKIYVQLATAINFDKTTPMKKVAFRVIRNGDIQQQKVYLDNIKLIYL